MAEYAELPTIIGRMKRAAIDAYMTEQGWHPHIFDDSIYALWGWAGVNSYDRPAADGAGGGTPRGEASQAHGSMAPTFDSIRFTIDVYTSPWLGLPNGSLCAPHLQSVGSAAATFGASGTGASVLDTGSISTPSSTIQQAVVNNMQGAFTVPFLDKYFSQFTKVTNGLGAACAILEMNYVVQSRIWPAARADATAICDKAREAFAAKAEQSSAAAGSLALTVVVAVAGAVATIATAGAATPLVTAMVGLSVTATTALAVIDATTTVGGSTYDEIMTSLRDALGTLNSGIAAQEFAVATLMSNASEAIRADMPNFNLDAYAMPGYQGAADTLSMDDSAAGHVSLAMTNVLDTLHGVEDALGNMPDVSPTPRDSEIGMGAEGTHAAAAELYLLTDQCLTLTTDEYERGLGLFEATVADFLSADTSATNTVNALAADEALIEGMTA